MLDVCFAELRNTWVSESPLGLEGLTFHAARGTYTASTWGWRGAFWPVDRRWDCGIQPVSLPVSIRRWRYDKRLVSTMTKNGG